MPELTPTHARLVYDLIRRYKSKLSADNGCKPRTRIIMGKAFQVNQHGKDHSVWTDEWSVWYRVVDHLRPVTKADPVTFHWIYEDRGWRKQKATEVQWLEFIPVSFGGDFDHFERDLTLIRMSLQ